MTDTRKEGIMPPKKYSRNEGGCEGGNRRKGQRKKWGLKEEVSWRNE
jgi:hypothetical protein